MRKALYNSTPTCSMVSRMFSPRLRVLALQKKRHRISKPIKIYTVLSFANTDATGGHLLVQWHHASLRMPPWIWHSRCTFGLDAVAPVQNVAIFVALPALAGTSRRCAAGLLRIRRRCFYKVLIPLCSQALVLATEGRDLAREMESCPSASCKDWDARIQIGEPHKHYVVDHTS